MIKNKLVRLTVGVVIGFSILAGSWLIADAIANSIINNLVHEQEQKENILKEVIIVTVPVEVEKKPEPKKEVKKAKQKPKKKLTKQACNYNFDVTKKSNITTQQLIKTLGPSRKGLHPYASAIVKAEEKYGVNALYLTATLGLESGWGKYTKGTNNIAGWKGNNGYFSNFNSKEACINTVASNIKSSFVKTHGKTVGGITKRYCTDYKYTETILSIMNDLQGGI